MSTDVGRDGGGVPSCYAEQYSDADAQRVLDYVSERREDGVSCAAIAKHNGLDEDVVEQIVVDLIHQSAPKLRRVYKGSVWLIFPPLSSYSKSIEQVVSEEQDKPKTTRPLSTPTRDKCLVTWCECMVPKKDIQMRDHLIRTHNIPPDVAERAVQALREGKRVDLDAERFLCQFCGEDKGSRAARSMHEKWCHKNPQRQANVDAMRRRKYGPNAVVGELTPEKFEHRGVECPVCGEIITGKGCYQRAKAHIRKEHHKTPKEAAERLRMSKVPDCEGDSCVIAPPKGVKVPAVPEGNTMSAVLDIVLAPKEQTARSVHLAAIEMLQGGIVTDVGVRTDTLQPIITLIAVEKGGQRHIISFDQPPKVDGRY